MGRYLVKRLVYMLIVIAIISILSFVIIQLPPGDYLTTYVNTLESSGKEVTQRQVQALRERYGLGRPMYIQYWKWISDFVHGDMGNSFIYNQPVSSLIWERLGLTFVIAFTSMLFTWIVAFPVGIISAVKQYSLTDYVFTFLSFIGLAIPNFMLALTLMYVGFKFFGINVSGLFSMQYQDAAWSMAKVLDLLKHLWVPVIVVGTAGTAGLVRIMRNNLLDELGKQYVITARAKGLSELKLHTKYPVRIALNPFISTVGWQLPRLISGSTITAVVLNLPTTGPLLLKSLKSQDMYLAGSFVMLLSILTVIGTLISDLLLAVLDPRIRYG